MRGFIKKSIVHLLV